MNQLSQADRLALMGKGTGAGIEPISLDPLDNDLATYRLHARRVIDEGAKFSSEQIHHILARLLLQE